MSIKFGDEAYKPMSGFNRLRKSAPLALSRFGNRTRSSFQRKTFLYHVQVVTTDKRTGEEIFRTINVAERERSPLNDILNSARDVIMDSPVSSREEFSRVELVSAYHNPHASNTE